MAGQAGIPADASAVAVNLAAVNPSAPGFVTAYPCGTTLPTASTLNHDTSPATSNAAIIKIGSEGKICLYTHAATDVIVDVTGWFPANADYTPLDPTRLLDTRTHTPASAGPNAFVESFTGESGWDRFEFGVYHRNVDSQHWTEASGGSWTADHDLNCGDPSTQREMHFDVNDDQATRIANTFFLCKDHLMSSVGDVDGYSIAWFSPKQTFQGGVHTQVSFDVNVTDLGARQWWEVSLVPIGSPFLATVDWVAHPANIDAYDDKTVVVGKGPLGNDGNIVTQGAFPRSARLATRVWSRRTRSGRMRVQSDPTNLHDHRQPQRHNHLQLLGSNVHIPR